MLSEENKYCCVNRIGRRRHNCGKSLWFNIIMSSKLVHCTVNHLNISFDNVAIGSRKFAPVTALLTDFIDTTIFVFPCLTQVDFKCKRRTRLFDFSRKFWTRTNLELGVQGFYTRVMYTNLILIFRCTRNPCTQIWGPSFTCTRACDTYTRLCHIHVYTG